MSLSDFLFGKKQDKKQKIDWDQLRKAGWVLNNDSHNPYGSVEYTLDPVSGKAVQTVKYSDGQQKLLTGSEGVSASANTLAQKLLEGAPQGAQSVSDSIYSQGASRLNPQWAEDEKQLVNRLYGQGIPEGSAAWVKAFDDFKRQRTDAFQTLNNNAVMGRDQSLASQANTATQLGGLGRPIDIQPPAMMSGANIGAGQTNPNAGQRSGGIVNPLLQLGSNVLGGWAYGGFA